MDYFVGIDFGHGETSAWYIPVSDDESISEKGWPIQIKNSNEPGGMKLPSVIYKKGDGNYSINLLPLTTIITRFKMKVSDLNQKENRNKKDGYAFFIKEVVERIILNNKDMLLTAEGQPNFYLCIACPTKWNHHEKEDYLNFFNEALCASSYNIKVHWVINESDAAYFTHRSDDQTVLVIDYGSSTIDYTLISKGTKIDIDELSNQKEGASKIELQMLEYLRRKKGLEFQKWVQGWYNALEKEEKKGKKGITNIDIMSELEYALRQAKEHGYTTYVGIENRPYDFVLNFDLSDRTEIDDDDLREIKLRDFFDNILGEYYSLIKSNFNTLHDVIKKKLPKNTKIDKIILSGGACIMPWVRTMVKEVFEVEPEAIIKDHNPEYVVAQGIALYAKAQYKALKKLEENVCKNDFIEMYKNADNEATQIAIKKLFPEKLKDIQGSEDLCGNEIREIIASHLRHFDSSDPDYRQIMNTQMNILLSSSVLKAVDEAIVKGFGKTLSEEDKKSISVSIPLPNLTWGPNAFKEGDKRYNTLTRVIASCKTNFTNWSKEKPRDLSRRRDIARIVLSYYSKYGALEISYDSKTLEDMEEKIKQAALKEAKRFFYQNELFKTTFKPE